MPTVNIFPLTLSAWLMSHLWRVSRVGSQGWAVEGHKVLWRMCQEMRPFGPRVPVPSAWAHSLQAQEGPPMDKPSLVHPKDSGLCSLEET